MAYLQEDHPELFFVLPRPGGIAKIELPEDPKVIGKGSKATLKSVKSAGRKSLLDPNVLSALTGYVSREQRIKTVLQSSPWVFFDDYQDITKPPSPIQDSIDLLAIAITTIMLLAADYKEISESHLRWTYSYLSCIKDETGRTPPNIKGIINHIRMLNDGISSFIEVDTDSNVEELERNVDLDDGKDQPTTEQVSSPEDGADYNGSEATLTPDNQAAESAAEPAGANDSTPKEDKEEEEDQEE